MKNKNKILAILVGVLALLFVAVLAITFAPTKEEPEFEGLEEPGELYELSGDSLVGRDNGVFDADIYNYELGITAKSQSKSGDETYLNLSDGSLLIVGEYMTTSNFSYSNEDGNIIIETPDITYTIRKIYNQPHTYVPIDSEEELFLGYSKIHTEYFDIYDQHIQNDDLYTTSLAHGGLNSYDKLQEYVNEHGLEYDVLCYSLDSVKQVMKYAFDIEIDSTYGELTIPYSMVAFRQSPKYMKEFISSNPGAFYGQDVYYMMADATGVYAVHMNYEIPYTYNVEFENLVNFVSLPYAP